MRLIRGFVFRSELLHCGQTAVCTNVLLEAVSPAETKENRDYGDET